MKESSRNNAPCAICSLRPADKTNSHLIPSFFIAMISSVDHSYKRDKELLYTINEDITTAYIGRGVREEELLRSFDSVSDERLDMMKQNTDSKDYIFCPHCERKLGEYLESPGTIISLTKDALNLVMHISFGFHFFGESLRSRYFTSNYQHI